MEREWRRRSIHTTRNYATENEKRNGKSNLRVKILFHLHFVYNLLCANRALFFWHFSIHLWSDKAWHIAQIPFDDRHRRHYTHWYSQSGKYATEMVCRFAFPSTDFSLIAGKREETTEVCAAVAESQEDDQTNRCAPVCCQSVLVLLLKCIIAVTIKCAWNVSRRLRTWWKSTKCTLLNAWYVYEVLHAGHVRRARCSCGTIHS